MEEKLSIGPIDIIPTFATLKVNNKKRRARFFGAVKLFALDNKIKTLAQAEYLFIKNEPKTIVNFSFAWGLLDAQWQMYNLDLNSIIKNTEYAFYKKQSTYLAVCSHWWCE